MLAEKVSYAGHLFKREKIHTSRTDPGLDRRRRLWEGRAARVPWRDSRGTGDNDTQSPSEERTTAQVAGLGTCTPVSRAPVRRRTEGEHANSPAARADDERMEPWSLQTRPRSCEGGGLCASSST